ncbi:hypothetical protein BJX61DRAFT_491970 [Aspergillus egyptiacus]|nr:hypothetical protein BJX61DRAFT_491970 [Aspergillus egyptiacus]
MALAPPIPSPPASPSLKPRASINSNDNIIRPPKPLNQNLTLTIPTIITSPPEDDIENFSDSYPLTPDSTSSSSSLSWIKDRNRSCNLQVPRPPSAKPLLQPWSTPSDLESEISFLDLGPAFTRSASPSPRNSLILSLEQRAQELEREQERGKDIDGFAENLAVQLQGVSTTETGMMDLFTGGFGDQAEMLPVAKKAKVKRDESLDEGLGDKRRSVERTLGLTTAFDRAASCGSLERKNSKRPSESKIRRRVAMHR